MQGTESGAVSKELPHAGRPVRNRNGGRAPATASACGRRRGALPFGVHRAARARGDARCRADRHLGDRGGRSGAGRPRRDGGAVRDVWTLRDRVGAPRDRPRHGLPQDRGLVGPGGALAASGRLRGADLPRRSRARGRTALGLPHAAALPQRGHRAFGADPSGPRVGRPQAPAPALRDMARRASRPRGGCAGRGAAPRGHRRPVQRRGGSQRVLVGRGRGRGGGRRHPLWLALGATAPAAMAARLRLEGGRPDVGARHPARRGDAPHSATARASSSG